MILFIVEDKVVMQDRLEFMSMDFVAKMILLDELYIFKCTVSHFMFSAFSIFSK